MTEATWQKRKFKLEKEIRGNSLIASIAIEVIIVDIIYYSNNQQYVDGPKSPSLKMKGLPFGGKITRLKELLQTHHKDLLDSNNSMFSLLEKFKLMRNRLCHCAFVWGKPNLEQFDIWDVDENEDKLQFYAPIKYTTRELVKEISSSFNEIVRLILPLRNEVILRLKQNHPVLYDALQSAVNRPDGET